MKTRRAISLIELLVVMSASTVVLTLTGVLLQRAMRTQMHSRALVDAERASLRLAEQFRRDVHSARAVRVSDPLEHETPFLRLDLAGGRWAEYSRVGGRLLRLESGGDKPTWREEFVFPAASELSVERKSIPSRLILQITAKQPEPPAAASGPLVSTQSVPVHIRAEAVVGRDFRFGGAPTGEGAPP
jgi:type II secretory pathway pseudopilin PulG